MEGLGIAFEVDHIRSAFVKPLRATEAASFVVVPVDDVTAWLPGRTVLQVAIGLLIREQPT